MGVESDRQVRLHKRTHHRLDLEHSLSLHFSHQSSSSLLRTLPKRRYDERLDLAVILAAHDLYESFV